MSRAGELFENGRIQDAVTAVRRLIAGSGKKYYVKTFGCQQNEADSERIAGMCEDMGYLPADSPDEASLIVVNTCAVREHAEKKAISVTGQYKHLKNADPGLVIAMCGCMVSQASRAEQIKKSLPYVDFTFGTSDIHLFPVLLSDRLAGGKRRFELPPDNPPIVEGIPVRRESGFRAWLSIMYGCDNFCSYCIVPYVRGRERSRNPADVLREAEELIGAGYRDVTLLGQNVNSYGRNCPFGCDFPGLMRRIDAIDGDYLIRFMTSHPKDATRELADTIAGSRHIAHQYHLPAQSGSDSVLRSMNRGYTFDEYAEKAGYIRRVIPDVTLTSDIIVGFPGENEEDFEDTLRLLRTVRYDMVYSFIYSPRRGTPAAEDPAQVPDEVKGERMRRLLELQTGISSEINEKYYGKVLRVLIHGKSKNDPGMLETRTEGGKILLIPDDGTEAGEFVNARVTGTGAFLLYGERG